MLKDVLVHVPTERALRPIVDGAVSFAAGFGAHLDAVAVGYVSTSTAYVMEGGAAVAAVFEIERENAIERAQAALGVFEMEAKNAGISYTCRAVGAIPAEATVSVGAAARLYDLAIVLQPEPEQGSFDNTLPQEILFQSGGPVLFLPHIFRGPFKAKRIGICWDGSRVAGRAVKDAMPFLTKAEELVIITVNEADSVPADASASVLTKHLARLGMSSRTVALSGTRSEIQPMILSLAADESLDMLVMGGYGHSRLQESFLGGVTRAMLETMTIPTLMSH